MNTTQIINGLEKNELLKWKAETNSILNELNWKRIRAERTLHLHLTALQECAERLQASLKRAQETKMALQFLSANHPLRHRCEDDLYRTEIRIFRLENKLKKISIIKPIQLEIKRLVLAEEINYYEGILKSIENMLRPTFILQPKQEAIDVRNLFYIPKLKQEAMDDLYWGFKNKAHEFIRGYKTTEIQDFS